MKVGWEGGSPTCKPPSHNRAVSIMRAGPNKRRVRILRSYHKEGAIKKCGCPPPQPRTSNHALPPAEEGSQWRATPPEPVPQPRLACGRVGIREGLEWGGSVKENTLEGVEQQLGDRWARRVLLLRKRMGCPVGKMEKRGNCETYWDVPGSEGCKIVKMNAS